jgi:hypothetical protein
MFLATSSESKKNKIWKCGRNVRGEYSDTTYEDIFSYEPIFVNKDGSVVVSTDISLIFNQQRLENKITASELREYIQRYTPNKSVYTAQLDDDTLLSTLKSRHIQSLSEMRSWAEYCMENYDSLIKDAEEKARIAAEEEASSAAAASSAPATPE